MYKIFHKLFGWDYVFWRVGQVGNYGVSRIKTLPDGTHYITRYLDAGFVALKFGDPYIKLTYLTCDPSKYSEE